MHTHLSLLALATALLIACAPSVDQQAAASSGAGGSAATAGTSGGGSTATSCPGADLMTDPLQCGSCGHSCLGGPCVAGACQAFRLATISAPSGSAPTALALDASNVYAAVNPSDSEPGGMFAMPRAGGTPTMLTDKNQIVTALAVTSSMLYWAQYEPLSPTTFRAGLYSVALAGNSNPTKIGDFGGPVVDDDLVYAGHDNEVVRLPADGGPPFVIGHVSGSNGIGEIAVDADSVFVSSEGTGHEPGSIQAFPKGGGQPSYVLHGELIDIALQCCFLYVNGPCGLCRLPTAGGPQQAIPIHPRIPTSELEPASPVGFKQFAVDDDWVYMTACNSEGLCDATKPNKIHRIPVTGGADHPVIASVFAIEIAVDDKALVWADANGDIWQLAK